MIDQTLYNKELRSVAKNAGISVIGIIFFSIMTYVNTIIITRHIDAHLYGLYSLAINIVILVTTLSLVGLPMGLVRFISHHTGKKEEGIVKSNIIFSIKIVLIISVILAILLYFIRPILAYKVFYKFRLDGVLKLFVFIIPFLVLTEIFGAVFRGLKLIKYQVMIKQLLSPFVQFVLLLVMIGLGFGFKAVLGSYVGYIGISFVAALVLVYFSYFRKNRTVHAQAKNSDLMKFSYPLYLNGFFLQAIHYLPIYFIGIYLTNTDIGVYSICVKLAAIISISLIGFNMIFAPTIANLLAQNEKELLTKLFKTTTRWIFTFGLIAFFVILLFSKQLLTIFGKEFVQGSSILIIFMIGELINAGVGPVGNILIMSGRPRIALYNSAIMFVLLVVLCIALVPAYGILGAALARAITLGIINIIRVVEVYYFEKITPFKISFLKTLLAGAISYFIVGLIGRYVVISTSLYVISGIIVYLILFILTLKLLKLDDDDLYILKMILFRFKKIK